MDRISSSLARLNDAAALRELLAPMRDQVSLRRKLRPGLCGHQYSYDLHGRTARYLLTNGEIVACYSVTGVSFEEARSIALLCDDLSEWSLRTFQDAVARALGTEDRRAH